MHMQIPDMCSPELRYTLVAWMWHEHGPLPATLAGNQALLIMYQHDVTILQIAVRTKDERRQQQLLKDLII